MRPDRLIFTADGPIASKIPPIKGFRVSSDIRPRAQGQIRTYDRVRTLRSTTDATLVSIQYNPILRWLKPCRVTVIGDDATGILLADLQNILAHCSRHRLSTVELALDFSPETKVDETFVRRHGRFGKARRKNDRTLPGLLRFGSRTSPKFVRCYEKRVLGRYRVELEVHSPLLRRLQIDKIRHLDDFALSLLPDHIVFLAVCWSKLEAYLRRKFGRRGPEILEDARGHARTSLRRVLRFLLEQHIPNPHRFLRQLAINDEIERALKQWAGHFFGNDH